MTRKETALHLFIGKTKNEEYIFLDNAFDNGSFKGLCGSGFRFYTEFAKENMEEDYFYGSDDCIEFFCDYVKRMHDLDCSYNDWVDMVKDENPNGACFDDSYSSEDWLTSVMELAGEKDWVEYVSSDCCIGWRMFDDRYLDKDFYEWVDEENLKTLIEYYNEYEKRETGEEPKEANKD